MRAGLQGQMRMLWRLGESLKSTNPWTLMMVGVVFERKLISGVDELSEGNQEIYEGEQILWFERQIFLFSQAICMGNVCVKRDIIYHG